ncbi:MAG: EamA family transporter [Flavipsychrobacter sp.]|nr:EamA family transporter [Flavipsychrobacter sp.]
MKKALLQIHLAVVLWGFTGVLGRAIHMDYAVLVWYRMALTAIFMAVILCYRRQWVRIPARDLGNLALIGCLMALHWVAFYGSIKLANASIALICLSTASIFTSLLDPFVNKGKHDLGELFIGFLALLGVYFIYQSQQAFSIGIIFGVISAILSSIFTMLNKRMANSYPARTMVFYEMATGFLMITLLLPFYLAAFPGTGLWPNQGSIAGLFTGTHSLAGHNDWIWLIILALCCTVWAQSLALNALKYISSFTATLSVNLEPIYGMALAFLFFNENKELTPGFYGGMALICFSVVLQTVRVLRFKAGYVKERGGIGE